jgi:hypothetical protein
MLAAERRDPQVVGRNWLSCLFQLPADRFVMMSGFLVNVEHSHRSHPLTKPALVGFPVSKMRDPRPIRRTGFR